MYLCNVGGIDNQDFVCQILFEKRVYKPCRVNSFICGLLTTVGYSTDSRYLPTAAGVAKVLSAGGLHLPGRADG